MYLSVVVPAYNEEKRLVPTLERIGSFMADKDIEYEIIVIDDGSSDNTREIVNDSLAFKRNKLILLKNEKNMGKGYSVKKGVEAALGDLILFSDADISTPISEIVKLIKAVEKDADIAIGSRGLSESVILERQPFYREAMGRTFNFIIRIILGENISDTQCGFKLFKKDAAKDLFSQMKINGFAFDAEMLFLARKMGFKVKEIGVIWKNCPHSKVHPIFSSLQMMLDILKIRFIHW